MICAGYGFWTISNRFRSARREEGETDDLLTRAPQKRVFGASGLKDIASARIVPEVSILDLSETFAILEFEKARVALKKIVADKGTN